jgi:DMSO/TMAO reductase YedYZ molybdopterin-dependent catalytic subunit
MSDGLKDEFLYDHERLERRLHAARRRTGLSRRQVLGLFSAAAGGVALEGWPGSLAAQEAPPPTTLKPLPTDKFRILGTNAETLWEAYKGVGYLTPASLFFVRNHTRTPQLDADTWRLTISGSGVSRPLSLSYNDLLKYRSVHAVKAIECAGNGRSFFASQQGTAASGTQWRLGAIGVGLWKGVRLSDVLAQAGLKRSAVDVEPQGLDPEVGTTGHVRRAIPIEKALDDVLLVYELNGKPLPPDHGFPVRVLVPGWIGVANVKWVGHIEVSETPLTSAWNTTQYRLFGENYPDTPVLSTQTVKSAFELPFPASLQRGWQLLEGRSWSAHGSIRKVEVSFDDGKRWWPTALNPVTNLPQAWAQWSFLWPAAPGSYKLRARATDSRGNVQPTSVPFNTQGYLFSGIVEHPVTVT